MPTFSWTRTISRFLGGPLARIAAGGRPALILGLLVLFVVVSALWLKSCLSDDPSSSNDGEAYVPPDIGVPQTTFSTVSSMDQSTLDIPVVMTEQVSRRVFEGTVVARLSPDGAAYLVADANVKGHRGYEVFAVRDIEGDLLWEYSFSNRSYRTSHIWYLAGGRYIGAAACDYDDEGEVVILEADGTEVTSLAFKGWTAPTMSAEGSWLALFNQRRNTLVVHGPPDLGAAWSLKVQDGAHGFFIGDGPQFFLLEPGRGRLFNGAGQVLWTAELPAGSRFQAAVSPDGRYLAASTDDPDASVYLYSVDDGALLWDQFLVAGGHRHLTFSPDSSSVVVYDIGRHGAIYRLDTVTGEIQWRFSLTGRADSQVSIERLEFTPNGEHMVADLVESRLEDKIYVFSHYLLLLDPDGKALWISPLGSQVDVEFSAAAGRALIVTNNTYDSYSQADNSVTVVSFLMQLPAKDTSGGG